jgi:hypothetical protein
LGAQTRDTPTTEFVEKMNTPFALGIDLNHLFFAVTFLIMTMGLMTMPRRMFNQRRKPDAD